MAKDMLFQEALEELFTIRDMIRWGASRFTEADLHYGHGTDSAWDDAVNLVLHPLHMSLPGDKRLLSARLTKRERQAILHLLQRRISERIPVPYLTHSAWFAGMEFYVDPRVLIPRSLLAELIEQHFTPWVLDELKINSILEIGTGSGCIACACAEAFPNANVTAVDISSDALEVASINVEKHDLIDRVQLLHGDLFKPVTKQKFDIIVTNPPYADEPDMANLPAEYRHEPITALAAGKDGLDIVKRILLDAAEHLNAKGLLICEVGNREAVLNEQFPNVPFYWLEISHGEQGVFLLTAEQLQANHEQFKQACQAIA